MKEYRQNSHTRSLIFWAALCTATALVLFIHSGKVTSRTLRVEEILAGVALLIFGPAALATYLIRSRAVWVSIDDARGIIVSGRRTLEWSGIRSVERRRPRLRRTSGPTEVSSFTPDVPDVGVGCADGCLIGGSEIFALGLLVVAALFAFWLVALVLVPLIVVPVLEVFAPFGDRIRIVSRQGILVLRDLRDADEFMDRLSRHAPVR